MPAAEIIEVCKKIGADLVVMSTHGRSGLGRWVFGNVAEKVCATERHLCCWYMQEQVKRPKIGGICCHLCLRSLYLE